MDDPRLTVVYEDALAYLEASEVIGFMLVAC
jgi:hypothetical protein